MVIQRWQSVLLLLVCALMGCFTFLSIGQVQTAEVTYNFTSCGFYPEGISTGAAVQPVLTWPLFVLSLVSAVLPFVDIFLYRRLGLQIALALVETVLIEGIICLAYWYGDYSFEGVSCSWSTLALAPFLAVIASVMAWRCMRRDRRLLRSADRLR